ncbi:PRC-barrel domain-containing protein [Aureimonas mangrovi]|uniref:PRC-barrel domain-containing protein n=1 Tax=Aureimonas mangrovi TaxID=2758041 RepID=UPI00163D941D|nr:PRC-barrel domain-containing protein [Aureimonas mangrovi]
MKKTFHSALLAGALMPFAAFAQTTTPPSDAPAGGAMEEPATPPAGGAMDSQPSDGMATPPAAEGEMETSTEAMGTASATGEGPFVTVPPTGAWRVSDLEGKNVEDATGESIGSISDVLVDENGEVIAVLVGVGGFLGIGAKDVAVSMEALEFGPGSTEGLSTAPAADAAPAGGTAPAAEAPAEADTAEAPPVIGEDNLPDRIVLNVTRDELEAAPAYGEPEDAAADAGGGETAPAGGTAPQ